MSLLTHRFYDSVVGRFVTRNPLGYAGGINLYGYTDNNPVNNSDPSGFCGGGNDGGNGGRGDTSAAADVYPGLYSGTARNTSWHQELDGLVQTGEQLPLALLGPLLGAFGGGGEAVAGGGGNYVYRALAEGEHEGLADGLFAREPTAITDILSHVANKRASEWISTSKSLENALGRDVDKGYGVVRIDLSKIGTEINDVSGGILKGGRFSSYAKSDLEVLIRWFVPPDAITVIHP